MIHMNNAKMSLISPKTIVITAYPGKQNNFTMSKKADISVLNPPVDPYDSSGPKKRRRLTHLSQDEKLLRRKLKNRVAAQTARDRKKALMTDLEEKLSLLEEENKILRKQNDTLRETSQDLVDENKALRSRLSGQSVPEAGTESEASRSAAPAIPLQKEQAKILSQLLVQYFTFVVTLSMIMSSTFSKKSQMSAVTAARKRKQPHPLRRVLPNSVMAPHPEIIHQEWWGSHQRSWNPSTN